MSPQTERQKKDKRKRV